MRILLLVGLITMLSLSTGCAWGKKRQPKNATHVYGGNAPTIVFSHEQERAGGPVRTY